MPRKKGFFKTPKGVITKSIHGQRARSKRKGLHPPKYTNKELQDWAFTQNKFWELYISYVCSGFKTKLVPSFDRIDSSLGYTLDNIQLMTWEDNNKKGRLEHARRVVQLDSNRRLVKLWESAYAVEKEGITRNRGQITRCCRGQRKTYKGFIWMYEEDYYEQEGLE